MPCQGVSLGPLNEKQANFGGGVVVLELKLAQASHNTGPTNTPYPRSCLTAKITFSKGGEGMNSPQKFEAGDAPVPKLTQKASCCDRAHTLCLALD